MDQSTRKSYLKKVKADTWAIELVIIGALFYVAYLILETLGYGVLNMGCSMPFYSDPVYNSEPDKIIYVKEVCLINIFWKIIPFILLPALLLSAALLSSSKQASLGMGVEGLYLVNKRGERPEFIESLRFVTLNKGLIFIYLIYSGFLLSGFTLTLHEIFNLIIVLSAFALFLDIWDWRHPTDQVWEERISGCRYKFTEKGKEGFDKHVKRADKWYWRLFYKSATSQIRSILYFLILAFMAFNVLREGSPPKDYDEVVYKRPAVMWKDNAYFALAGLNAPVNIDDFYEYGRQKAIFHSKFFTDYKAAIGIPFIQPVPETELTLYDPETIDEQIEFQDKEIVDEAICLYDIRVRKEASADCPSMTSVLPAAIEKNQVLWQRFNKMPDHVYFSMPDISGVTDNYNGSTLISLAILKAIQIVDMQATGREEEAFSEWLRYTEFYFKLFTTPSAIHEKASFLILVAIQANILETLLYNNPSLAVTYGDTIIKTLDIQSVGAFRLDRMIADDWSFFEVFILSGIGSSPLHKRQIYACFKEEQKRADMTAKEYFQSSEKLPLCRELYPNDVGNNIKRSFIQPGNPISNIAYYLLITGLIKGEEIVTSTQHQIITFRMIKAAVTMLQQDIKASEVQTFLDYAPADMQNPITETPFLWDRQEKKIYYKNPDHPEMEPRYGFYVNVRDDF